MPTDPVSPKPIDEAERRQARSDSSAAVWPAPAQTVLRVDVDLEARQVAEMEQQAAVGRAEAGAAVAATADGDLEAVRPREVDAARDVGGVRRGGRSAPGAHRARSPSLTWAVGVVAVVAGLDDAAGDGGRAGRRWAVGYRSRWSRCLPSSFAARVDGGCEQDLSRIPERDHEESSK